jgi:Na+-driven multidrug efflux pump
MSEPRGKAKEDNRRRENAPATFQTMTTKPVRRLVTSFAVPSVASALLLSAYQLLDSLFASQAGNRTVAAVSAVFPLAAIIQTIGFWIGMGGSSLLSEVLGKQRETVIRPVVTASAVLIGLFAVVLAIGGIGFPEVLVRMLGCANESRAQAVVYCRYLSGAAVFFLITCVYGNELRAVGKPYCFLWALGIGIVVDLLLQYELVTRNGMGIHGIGVGALVSQMVMAVVIVLFGLRQNRPVSSKWEIGAAALLILKVGSPSIFRQGTGSIAAVVMNHVALAVSADFLSAMCVSSKCTLLLLSIAIGYSQAIQPVIGYNAGAGERRRVLSAFANATVMGSVVLSIAAACASHYAPQVLQVFSDEPAVIRIAAQAFRLQCLALPFVTFANAANMLYQATNRPIPASFIAALRQGILLLPMLWLLPRLLGNVGILLAQPISDVLTTLVSIPFVLLFFRKRNGGG